MPTEASLGQRPALATRVVGRRTASPPSLSAALAAGGPGAVLALQRAAGNRAVTSLLQPHKSVVARCAGGCTCGGTCADERLLQHATKPSGTTASVPAQHLERGVRRVSSPAGSARIWADAGLARPGELLRHPRLQRDPAVCDPSVSCCPAGTVGPDGTPNTGTDTIPTPDSSDGRAPQPNDGGLPPGGVAHGGCEERSWPNGCAGAGGCDAGKTCVAPQEWPVCACWG